MTEDELLEWRNVFRSMLLAELTVRNTILLETMQARTSGQTGATLQDGIQRTIAPFGDNGEAQRKAVSGERRGANARR